MLGFGHALRGQQAAGRVLGEYTDNAYIRHIEDPSLDGVKETEQAVCSAGVGYGKSTLVSNALPLLREHCTNEAVTAMLNESRFPLAIHLTFSTKHADFNPEIEKSIPHAVIRRMLCHCLPDLSWNNALRLPLSDSLQVQDCLGALVAYHREVCGLRQSSTR